MGDCEITCKHHGPLKVEGTIVLKDQDGKEFDLGGRTVISLCRCGHSENKPFCDGGHKKFNFQSHIEAGPLTPPKQV